MKHKLLSLFLLASLSVSAAPFIDLAVGTNGYLTGLTNFPSLTVTNAAVFQGSVTGSGEGMTNIQSTNLIGMLSIHSNSLTDTLTGVQILPPTNYGVTTSNFISLVNIGDAFNVPALGAMPFGLYKLSYNGIVGANLRWDPAYTNFAAADTNYASGYFDLGQEQFGVYVAGKLRTNFWLNSGGPYGGMQWRVPSYWNHSSGAGLPSNAYWNQSLSPFVIMADTGNPPAWLHTNQPLVWLRGTDKEDVFRGEFLRMENSSDTGSNGVVVNINRQRGTFMHTGRNRLGSGDAIGTIRFNALKDQGTEVAEQTNYGPAVIIEAVAGGAQSASATPGQLNVYITPSGSTTPVNRMTILENGFVGLGGETLPYNALSVRGSLATGTGSYGERTAPTGGATIGGKVGILIYSGMSATEDIYQPLTVNQVGGMSAAFLGSVGIGGGASTNPTGGRLQINIDGSTHNAIWIGNTEAGGQDYVISPHKGSAGTNQLAIYNASSGQTAAVFSGTNVDLPDLRTRSLMVSNTATVIGNTTVSGTLTVTNGVFGASGTIACTTQAVINVVSGVYTNVLFSIADYVNVFGGITASTDGALTNAVAGRYMIHIGTSFHGAGASTLYEAAVYTNNVECPIVEWLRDVASTAVGNAHCSAIVTLPANCRIDYRIKNASTEDATFRKLHLNVIGAN